MNQQVLTRDNDDFHVTITMGIYEYNTAEDNYDTLLDKVDFKMYQNKKHKITDKSEK